MPNNVRNYYLHDWIDLIKRLQLPNNNKSAKDPFVASIPEVQLRGAAIAQWIRLRLLFCCPGFESQAYHLSFNKFIIVSCGKDENERKRGRDWPIKNRFNCTFKDEVVNAKNCSIVLAP